MADLLNFIQEGAKFVQISMPTAITTEYGWPDAGSIPFRHI